METNFVQTGRVAYNGNENLLFPIRKRLFDPCPFRDCSLFFFFITLDLVQLFMILCPYLDGLKGPLKFHGHLSSETVWTLANKLRAVKPWSYL